MCVEAVTNFEKTDLSIIEELLDIIIEIVKKQLKEIKYFLNNPFDIEAAKLLPLKISETQCKDFIILLELIPLLLQLLQYRRRQLTERSCSLLIYTYYMLGTDPRFDFDGPNFAELLNICCLQDSNPLPPLSLLFWLVTSRNQEEVSDMIRRFGDRAVISHLKALLPKYLSPSRTEYMLCILNGDCP